MCLSTVYLEEKREEAIVIKEASKIRATPEFVEVQNLFGEKRLLSGYFIEEVDLLKNYVLLREKS